MIAGWLLRGLFGTVAVFCGVGGGLGCSGLDLVGVALFRLDVIVMLFAMCC